MAIVLLLVGFAVVKIDAVAAGSIGVTRSDDGARTLWAQALAIDPGRAFSLSFFTHVWPYGPPLVQAFFLRAVYGLGLDGGLHYSQWLVILTVFAYVGAVASPGLLAWRLGGPLAGLLGTVALVGAVVSGGLSTSALAEPYALLFVALGMIAFVRADAKSGGMLPSACWLLVAQVFRSDVLFVALGLGLYLVSRRQWRNCAIFLSVSLAFLVAKQLVVIATEFEGLTYATMHQFYRLHERSLADRCSQVWRIHILKGWLVAGEYFITLGTLALTPAALALRSTRPLALAGGCASLGPVAMMLAGLVGFGPRYAIIGRSLLLVAAASVVGICVDRLARRTWTPAAIASAALLVGVGGLSWDNAVYAHRASLRQNPPAVREAAQWLRRHTDPGEPIFFDYMLGWSSYLNTWTTEIDVPAVSFSRARRPRLPPSSSPPPADRGERAVWAAHRFLQHYRPRYVVLAGERLRGSIEQIDPQRHVRRGMRHSYLWPYLQPSPDGQGFLLDPVVRDVAAPIALRAVFENPFVEIYELEIGPPAERPPPSP